MATAQRAWKRMVARGARAVGVEFVPREVEPCSSGRVEWEARVCMSFKSTSKEGMASRSEVVTVGDIGRSFGRSTGLRRSSLGVSRRRLSKRKRLV